MVENELVTGSLASRHAALARYNNEAPPQMPRTPSEYQYQRESTSLDSESGNGSAAGQRFERSMSGHVRGGGGDRGKKVGSEGGRLYAEFMRSGGGNGGGGGVTSLQGKGAGAGEWQGDYLSNGNGSASGDTGVVSGEGRFEEVRSP
ncbi:hypothetical protein N7G274_003861 [Stereocaulon virgatum]|uniref:Uncharacterized protein n=1 Tax=Stereocaulon virgatum TaxID=373712 RepID=A0ABR4ADJ7_9LECA